jgi:protein-tyrosine phosphatase
MTKTAVLFVCTGNICRSPTAHGVFRHMVREAGLEDDFFIDSAGTHDYHAGEPPDPRAIKAARARCLNHEDFNHFDVILAMDSGHLAHMAQIKKKGRANIVPFDSLDVPDPYYSDEAAFQAVFNQIEGACRKWLEFFKKSSEER